MANLPKGTLAEKIEDSEGTTTTETTTEATIKVAPTTVLNPPSNEAAPTIVKEPLEEAAPSEKEAATKKASCTICKAKSVASLAFSFSLVILVLAFSFSLVKPSK
jgi:hypothetical protein